MKRAKRMVSIFMGLVLAVTLTSNLAGATEITPYASEYLSLYTASMATGSSTGAVKINYTVYATRVSDLVGASSIAIYKANGSYVTTITGTVENGMLLENSRTQMSSYTYYGESGTSYYAIVTAYAARGSGSDAIGVRTNDATAA